MQILPVFKASPLLLPPAVRQAIKQINHAHYLFLFTPEERRYTRTRQKVLRDYQQRLKNQQSIPEQPRTFLRTNSEQEQRVCHKKNFYEWKKLQYQSLTNESIWLSLTQAAYCQASVQHLKNQWQNHGVLSRWNHQTLLHVATVVLPFLIQYHQQALVACQNLSFIPTVNKRAYEQYLKDFLQQAKKLQCSIAESMLARLQAFERSQFQYADVTKDVITQLQLAGSLSKEMALPHEDCFEPLTSEQFSVFHGYLSQHLPKEEEKLAKFSWFNPSGQLSLLTKEHSLKTHLVPKALAGFISLSHRKPAFLFRGHHFRRKFFKNKSIRLAALTSPTVYPHALSQSAITHTLQQLQQKESNFHELQMDLSQQKRRFSSFRYGQTQRFLQQWGMWLQGQQTQVRNIKMDFFQRLLNDFETRQGGQLIFSWETCQALEKTLRQLQQESYPGKGGEEAALISITKRFETWLSLNKAYQLIKNMEEGKLIQPSELAFINDYYQTLQLYRPQEAQAFTEMAQPLIDACCKKLKMALSTFSLTEKNNSNLQRGADEVLALDYLVGIFSTSAQKAAISSQLSKFTLRYLTTLLSSNEMISSQAYQVVETILQHAGENIDYGAQTLATWVTELKQLREQGEWGVLRAKCQSLVVIINQNLLQKRLIKEIAYLDEGMKGILENHPDLRDSPASVNTLLQLRDQMVEKGISDVEQIRLTLPVHQQVLINKVCQHNKAIAPLFKLSSKVHAIYRQQQTHSSLLEKNAQIEKLQHTASKVFSGAPQLRTLLQSHAAFFKKRDFFSKRYVDETVSKQLTR